MKNETMTEFLTNVEPSYCMIWHLNLIYIFKQKIRLKVFEISCRVLSHFQTMVSVLIFFVSFSITNELEISKLQMEIIETNCSERWIQCFRLRRKEKWKKENTFSLCPNKMPYEIENGGQKHVMMTMPSSWCHNHHHYSSDEIESGKWLVFITSQLKQL